MPSVAQYSGFSDSPPTLASLGMIHQFRQTRDPGLLAEQLYALQLHRQQVPPDEIVRSTMRKRREWARLRTAVVGGDWDTDEYSRIVTRLIGRAASQWLGAGSTGVEAANLAIAAYEDTLRGDRLSRAAHRWAADFVEWETRV